MRLPGAEELVVAERLAAEVDPRAARVPGPANRFSIPRQGLVEHDACRLVLFGRAMKFSAERKQPDDRLFLLHSIAFLPFEPVVALA